MRLQRRTIMSNWRRLTMKPVWQTVAMVMLSTSVAMVAYAASDVASEAVSADHVKLLGLLFALAMGIFAIEARVSKRIVVPTALVVVNDRIEKHLSSDHAVLLKKIDELLAELRAYKERSDGEIRRVVERVSHLEGEREVQHGGKR